MPSNNSADDYYWDGVHWVRKHDVFGGPHDELDYDQMEWDELGIDEILAADEQEKRHAADPSQPKYLPADAPGYETKAWTAGGPEEDDA